MSRFNCWHHTRGYKIAVHRNPSLSCKSHCMGLNVSLSSSIIPPYGAAGPPNVILKPPGVLEMVPVAFRLPVLTGTVLLASNSIFCPKEYIVSVTESLITFKKSVCTFDTGTHLFIHYTIEKELFIHISDNLSINLLLTLSYLFR